MRSASRLLLAVASVVAVVLLGDVVATPTPHEVAQAVTQVERMSLFANDDFVFNFLNPPNVTGNIMNGEGGHAVLADASNFPALIGQNAAMAWGILEPCGMILPHIHPRATELHFVISGEYETGFIMESGATAVLNTKRKAGTVTVFPMGSIHFEVNMSCEQAMFVAAFNNQDPGRSIVAGNYFSGIPEDVIQAALANVSMTTVDAIVSHVKTLKNPGQGVAECLKRCNVPAYNPSYK